MKVIIIPVSLRQLDCIADKLSQSDDRNPHSIWCTSILGSRLPRSKNYKLCSLLLGAKSVFTDWFLVLVFEFKAGIYKKTNRTGIFGRKRTMKSRIYTVLSGPSLLTESLDTVKYTFVNVYQHTARTRAERTG